jgi:hypothetical protein
VTSRRRPFVLPLLAAVGAIGFAVHLLVGGAEPNERARAAEPPSPAEEPLEQPTKHPAPPPATEPPSAEESMQRLARALPHTERDAQRLKLVELQALVAQGKVGAARGRAHEYFERWPNGPDIAAIEQLTGAHPTR